MASSPELFVVCKNCNSQVSPYITECPYCGTRLRKRAPKIERKGEEAQPKEPKRRRKVKPALGPLRSGEIPGIRADELRRPVVTIAIVALGCLWWLAIIPLDTFRLYFDPLGEWWNVVTAPFVHYSAWYQFAALGTVGLFGWLLERRYGPLAVLVTWIVGAHGGMAVVKLLAGDDMTAVGATGGALALLCAWAVPPLMERRRTGDRDDDVDLLGPAVLFVLLALMPVARYEVSEIATGVGILAGAAIGLGLSRARG